MILCLHKFFYFCGWRFWDVQVVTSHTADYQGNHIHLSCYDILLRGRNSVEWGKDDIRIKFWQDRPNIPYWNHGRILWRLNTIPCFFYTSILQITALMAFLRLLCLLLWLFSKLFFIYFGGCGSICFPLHLCGFDTDDRVGLATLGRLLHLLLSIIPCWCLAFHLVSTTQSAWLLSC